MEPKKNARSTQVERVQAKLDAGVGEPEVKACCAECRAALEWLKRQPKPAPTPTEQAEALFAPKPKPKPRARYAGFRLAGDAKR